MKNITKTLSVFLLLSTLAGCSDAHVKLNDANTAIMKVGNESITKGQVFNMLNTIGGDLIIDNATQKICDLEAPVDETMQANVDTIIDSIKASGDTLLDYYASVYGGIDKYTEQLLKREQTTALYEKYVTANVERYISEQQPAYVTILTFTSEEDANKALTALNDGSKSIEEVIVENGSSSTGKPEIITLNTTTYAAEALTVARTNKKDDGWAKVNASTNDQFYLIRVEEDDAANYKDDLIPYLATFTSIQDDALAYYLKEHKFRVYDKGIYDQIKESNPALLNQ